MSFKNTNADTEFTFNSDKIILNPQHRYQRNLEVRQHQELSTGRTPWTLEDDLQLMIEIGKMGDRQNKNWRVVGKVFPDRPNYTLRNRYKFLMKRLWRNSNTTTVTQYQLICQFIRENKQKLNNGKSKNISSNGVREPYGPRKNNKPEIQLKPATSDIWQPPSDDSPNHNHNHNHKKQVQNDKPYQVSLTDHFSDPSFIGFEEMSQRQRARVLHTQIDKHMYQIKKLVEMGKQVQKTLEKLQEQKKYMG